MSFIFSTAVERKSDGEFIVTIANSSYAGVRTTRGTSEGTAPGPEISQIYLEIGETVLSPRNGSIPGFVDRNGDSCISEGDYYVVPACFAGETVQFRSLSGEIRLTHTCYAPGSSRPLHGECRLHPRGDATGYPGG